ncbi:TatD family hydrolase [Polaribacter butkevichii]|uniref:Hydrolase TatD n=1 Tax=Polaribacter butkevichii TaxID=218490 RepID=A0A2P6CA15_9FLAO|nr:TatD family hydrolase [Polaribacter butkevichii]PQJ71754.1 hypothetical protein BTO14_00140 [Polaribacter butkevichii]
MLFLDVHTHKIYSNENVFSIVNTYPNSTSFSQPFSIGIHPWFINQETLKEELLFVEHQLQKDNCFAVGECGLDKLSKTDLDIQKDVFKKQVALSEKYQKPIIIHCVRAHQEIIAIKKEVNPKQVWILHGFHKSKQLAENCIKNGLMLSFGAAFIKNKKLQETFLALPLSSIVLETDDNEIDISEIYKKASEIKNISVENLQQKITQNFINLIPQAQRGFNDL